MKKQNLYNVTVYATLSKDVLVYAENEDAALNYVQDVCDNTDLISFDGREILDVTAEEVEEIEPADKGEPAEECCENRLPLRFDLSYPDGNHTDNANHRHKYC